jgi:tetratricopeptide (TPR) repeat protein
MDDEDHRILAYASALGSEFEFDLLVRVLQTDPESLAERLESLIERGLLKERPGGGRFAFVDDGVRAQVYQSMTESRLRVIHRRIAQMLDARYPTPPPEIIPELGRHYFLGKVPQKAWEFNRDAAELARRSNQVEAAIHHLERARRDLASLPGNHLAQLAELDERLGHLQRQLGRPDAAEEAYLAALNRIAPKNREARARLLLARAEMARSTARRGAAQGMGEEALQISREIGDLRGQAEAHRIRGRMALERGEFTMALDEQMVALDYLQRVGDRPALGECCSDIALTFSVLSPQLTEDAVRWYRRAIEFLEPSEAHGGTARAYAGLAIVVGRNDPIQALEWLERSRVLSEEVASPEGAIRATLLSIEYQLALGHVEEAERGQAMATRLLERVDDPRGLQLAAYTHGMIAERRAQWEEAELAYRDSAMRADQLGLIAENAESEFRLAGLLFKTRDFGRARDALRRVELRGLVKLRPTLAPSIRELERQLEMPTTSPEPEPKSDHPEESPRAG